MPAICIHRYNETLLHFQRDLWVKVDGALEIINNKTTNKWPLRLEWVAIGKQRRRPRIVW